MPRLIRFLALAATIGGFGAPTGSSAAVFCVNDGPSLQAALTEAASNSEHDEIRLRSGSYTMPSGATAFTYTSNGAFRLELSGGWQSVGVLPCLISQADPSLTVLDGVNQRRVMDLTSSNTAFIASVTVRNLTIRRGSGNQFGGLRVKTGSGTVALDRLILRNNNATNFGSPGGLLIPSARFIFINNSLILDNTCTNGPCGARVSSTTSGFLSMRLQHNTVARNRCPPGFCAMTGVLIEGTASAELGNNALHDNQGAQLELVNPNVTLRHNLLGSLIGTPAASFGNLAPVDPRFIDPDQGNYRLRMDSPLLDAGDPSIDVGDFDLDGNPRVNGRGVDIGAYELPYLVFEDDFESRQI